MAEGGALAAVTAPHTGRSPNDKFIVREPASADEMWWNRGNQPLEADAFERLKASLLAHLAEQELFVRDLFAGADAEHRFGLRFVTPNAWHALFVYNMFLRPSAADLSAFVPAWTVLHAPEFHADPAIHGTKSGTFVVIHFSQRTILIGGTRYAGEMKKSVFTILNYLLPKRGVLSIDRKSTRLNSSHSQISYAVFCLKKKNSTSSRCTGSSRSEQPCCRRRCPSPAHSRRRASVRPRTTIPRSPLTWVRTDACARAPHQ